MFNSDNLIKNCLINPDQTWVTLDSFWRANVTPNTQDLLHFQSWASLLLELNVHSRSTYFTSGYSVPTLQPFLTLPWYPIVLYEDRLSDVSFILYGDPYEYSPIPEIFYGQAGPPQFVYPLPFNVVDVPELTNAVTDPTVVLDHSQFVFDPLTGKLTFSVNPFTLINSKIDAGSGRSYIILWVRNLQLDLNMPFDQVGWVIKYDQLNQASYADGLKALWELVLLGPSLERYQRGLMAAMAFPYALTAGVVTRVDDDGWQWIISTEAETYTVLKVDATPTVEGGDQLTIGQPLTDGVLFLEYQQLLTVSNDVLPGLVLQIPLSTGVVAQLSFANITTAWTYDVARPSPWRFPIGGDLGQVEQFWIDSAAYAAANSIDLATVYGLPATVNPMVQIVTDLPQNNLYVVSVDLRNIPRNPGGFHDRARQLLPPSALIVLEQLVADDIADTYDSTTVAQTITYGYNAAVPTEVISVTGTDLTYNDLTPLVVTY